MVGLKTLVVLGVFVIVSCATSDKNGGGRAGGDGDGAADTGAHTAFTPNNPSESSKTLAEGINVSPDELITTLTGRLPVERDAKPSVHPRKGVSSITPRKGVDNPSSLEEPENTTEPKIMDLQDSKDLKNGTSTEKTPYEVDLMKSMDTKITKTTEKTKLKKFKPKPTVTVAGALDVDVAKPSPGVPTKIPPLGMPSKINYVVPVIITILVLPLFVLFVIFLYRNGRECWEKRHYRRMDFLIDGMYNE